MKSNVRYSIIIIEASEIICTGLKHLIVQTNKECDIDVYSSLSAVQEKVIGDLPNLILINPSLIDQSKRTTVKHLFGAVPMVAIVHDYFDSGYLNQFHDCLEINDDKHKIRALVSKYLNAPLPLSISDNENSELSDREIEILIAVTKGLINKEIADLLNISVHTVMSHRKNITRKTGIKSISGLTLYAVLNNYITPQELG